MSSCGRSYFVSVISYGNGLIGFRVHNIAPMTSKILKIIFSLSIVATVLFFTGGNLFALFQGYMQDDRSIFSLALDQVCIPMVHTPPDLQHKKLVILRLDDVQAYSWRDISMQMVRDAQRYNAPVVT